MSGNKKIDNYSEKTESDKINEKYGVNYTPTITSKDKFEKSYDAYKKDPLAEMRPYLTQEAMSKPMPGGSGQTVGEFVKNQEKIAMQAGLTFKEFNDYINSLDDKKIKNKIANL